MLVIICVWLRISVHASSRKPKPPIMAAIVEKAENRLIGNDLAYSQSSASDGLHSSESALDPSKTAAKAVAGLNGLSHLDEDSLVQKTGANTQGPGTVKADTQLTLVNCNVTKTEKDFGEKSKTGEVVAAKMDCQPVLSQSIQNKSTLLVAGSPLCEKVEEKVELKVPLDSKSNCSLSIKNAENKLSPYDVEGTKEFSLSCQHSGLEQKVEIKSKILECKTNKILDCKTNEQFSSSEDTNDKEKPLISKNEKPIRTSTLEDKQLQSDFNDNKLCKSVDNISINGNMDNFYLQEMKTISPKSATNNTATLKKDLTDIDTVADEKEKTFEETNSKNCSESSSNSQSLSESLSKTETEKSSSVSNIPELLSYCSPCQVVVQDFFKELNIDLLELSRNFPVHRAHRKRLKISKPVKNNSFDSLNQTKPAKCYTENIKRRKKHPTTLESQGGLNDSMEDEDEEDNLPLLSVRNNLIQDGNAAADFGKSCAEEKSNSTKTTTTTTAATAEENLKMTQTKGGNSDAVATEEKGVTNSTSSDVPIMAPLLMNPSTNAKPSDPVIAVPPTVNISDSNDLGLKIVSISSQGAVFFPAFAKSDNSENIVFRHPDTTSNLNGQLDATTSGNSTTKLSPPPKCKFHGPNSSPVQNLYKCKKCGLEAKSLSDIQAHMAGSHSEFCMYRCPFCIPPLRVKRVSIYDNRPIEFEVLRESGRKLKASVSSTKKTSATISAKRKLPRHIRIQREKRRKLNYYYHNQREIKNYKNKKVSCQYCLELVNQSNISRHQNSKKCTNPGKNMMLREKIPKKYQKVKCDSCQKQISRTNMSKHSKICPREMMDE